MTTAASRESRIVALDIAKARVVHPNGSITGLFVYFRGAAAVWVHDLDNRRSTRVLYIPSGAIFERRRTARNPHILTLQDGSQWVIVPRSGGGCNCGSGAPTSGYSLEALTSPDLVEI